MADRTTAAGQIWRNLPSAGPEPPQRKHSDLASVMYPALSREVKAQQAAQARAREEQKTRSARTAANQQAAIDALHRERGC